MWLKKKINFTFVQIVILLLLFLGTVNFGNLYFYFIFGAALLAIAANHRTLRVDWMVAVLLLLSLCYIFFYPSASNSFKSILKYALYPMCYLMGLNFVRKEDKGKEDYRVERQIIMGITICAMGMFVHYLLNMSVNFNRLVRNSVDFWTGELMAATGQAGLAVLALGVFIAWLYDDGKKKVYAAIGLFLVLLYNMVLAGRTLLLLTALLFIAAFLYNIKSIRAKKTANLFCTILFVFVILLVAYAENWGGVREFILGSNLSERFDSMDISSSIRFERKTQFFMQMFDHPFGGGELRRSVGGYAHELYLDVYSDAGILAYVLVIIFAFDAFRTAFNLVRKGIVSERLKQLALCVYIAIFFEFFLEPIIQGMPWMFCTFCFIGGLLKNVKLDNRQSSETGGTV